MWHEARKHEKATQRLFNEQRKRAEIKREENRVEPDLLLQVNGVKSNLCYDASVYRQAIKCLVPWQGDPKVTIDRFDIRSTIDTLPEPQQADEIGARPGNSISVVDTNEDEITKKILRYERYRLLVQSELVCISEEQRLKLVAESDQVSESRLNKLRKNNFGTSGEVPLTGTLPMIKIRMLPNRDELKIGARIPHNYDSDSLASDSKCGTWEDKTDICNGPQASVTNSPDDSRLDAIKLKFPDIEKLGLVTRKYGLTPEEFMILAKYDAKIGNQQVDADLRKDLINLMPKRIRSKPIESHDRNQNYGPSLPPELATKRETTRSPSSGEMSPPKRPRSPISGTMLPLRRPKTPESPTALLRAHPSNARMSSDRARERSTAAAHQLNSEDDQPRPSTSHTTTKLNLMAQHSARNSENGAEKGHDSKSSDDSRTNQYPPLSEPKAMPERRAATPLAYKRFCRSSRSVSRERQSGSHRRGDRRSSSQERYRRAKARVRPSSKSSFSSIISTTSKSSDQQSIKPPRKKRRRRGGRRRGRRSSRRRR